MKQSSVLIFLPSISTPTASKPKLSRYSRRPTHTKTTSASSVSAPPPAAASTPTFTMPSALSTEVTLVSILKVMPCFFRSLCISFATSPSMPKPPMVDKNSTTVTFEPKRSYTEPSSKPMTPPPITINFSGTFFKDSAPVEDTICSSSMGAKGKDMMSEPVASMMFLAEISSSPPSFKATLTDLGPVIVPWPLTYVTLFFLNSISMPPVNWLTASVFFFIIWSKSMDKCSEPLMPLGSKSVLAWWYKAELCSSALDGMHPTLRQVPPSFPRFSMHTVFRPIWAALIAPT
mmetsp:Transcript_59789/g.142319  ORF Transcript_59789/g.142319 Transcript_59789/m.142319 type:complete len:289 (-) Transcript_59789:211-1077(-)